LSTKYFNNLSLFTAIFIQIAGRRGEKNKITNWQMKDSREFFLEEYPI